MAASRGIRGNLPPPRRRLCPPRTQPHPQLEEKMAFIFGIFFLIFQCPLRNTFCPLNAPTKISVAATLRRSKPLLHQYTDLQKKHCFINTLISSIKTLLRQSTVGSLKILRHQNFVNHLIYGRRKNTTSIICTDLR